MTARRVVLIRHGESQWNASGQWQGHGGPGLSQRGRRQAAAVARSVSDTEPHVCLVAASDLPRATETAELTAEMLGQTPTLDHRLREIDVGWWSGLTTDEIVARDPETVAALEAGQDVPRGGAETAGALRARVVDALEEIAAACDGGTLLVFSHGGPVRAVVGHLLGLTITQQGGLAGPDNCSRTVVTYDARGARLRTYNETAHLNGA
jgi:probable phosphoglycerate mutase